MATCLTSSFTIFFYKPLLLNHSLLAMLASTICTICCSPPASSICCMSSHPFLTILQLGPRGDPMLFTTTVLLLLLLPLANRRLSSSRAWYLACYSSGVSADCAQSVILFRNIGSRSGPDRQLACSRLYRSDTPGTPGKRLALPAKYEGVVVHLCVRAAAQSSIAGAVQATAVQATVFAASCWRLLPPAARDC